MPVTYEEVKVIIDTINTTYPGIVPLVQELWTELEAYRVQDPNQQWGKEHSYKEGETLSDFVEKNRGE